jgi:hypothetical protein
MLYVRFPLSLRNVEDFLGERWIEISQETVRFWWNRFGPVFAAETVNHSGRRRRVLHLTNTHRDLPQQLYQRDYLTKGLYRRMNRAHRWIMDIEPLEDGDAADTTAKLYRNTGNTKGYLISLLRTHR